MTMTIWKYEIDWQDEVEIEMPKDAQILCVENQRERLCIWVLCDPNANTETRTFRICPTGEAISGTYIGSAIFQNGAYVWHLFEGE